jgi:phage major head subunit gpT-like protein
MIDDDEYGIVTKFASSLPMSAQDTRETLGADLFNQGFVNTTYSGGDGLALFSAVHPLVAGTYQNTLSSAADLSITSLRQACQDFQGTVDDRGLIVNIMPKTLLVPKEEQWNAHELLKSPDRPDTAARAINAFQMKSLDYVVWNYLTDPDAWFLLADNSRHDLHWYDREAFNAIHYEDYSARAVVTQGYMRFSYGFNDWRGVYGSPGA